MRLKSKVLSGLRWTAGLRFLSQFLTWAVTIFVMRLLKPEDYGLMAMAMVFVGFLAMLNQVMGTAIIQKPDMDQMDLQRIFGLLLVINFFLFLCTFFMAPTVAAIFEEQKVQRIIRVLSFLFILSPLSIIPQSMLRRDMYFKKISTVEFASALLGSGLTLVLALNKWGIWSLVWGTISLNICKTIFFNFMFPYLRLPQFSFQRLRQVMSFSAYVSVNQIIWYFYNSADILLVGKLLGRELLGFYSVAMQVASIPMEKISGIINQVALPAYASIQKDPEMAGLHFLKTVRIMAILAFPVMWGISCTASELVPLILGDKWRMAIVPLQLLCLVMPVRMIQSLTAPAMFGLGRPEIVLKNTLLAFVIIPIAIGIGCKWGISGVALAWVISFPLVFLRNISRVVKVFGLKVIDVIAAMAKPFVTAIAMYAAVTTVKMQLQTKLDPIVLVGAIITIGVSVYVGIILAIDHRNCRKMLELIRL